MRIGGIQSGGLSTAYFYGIRRGGLRGIAAGAVSGTAVGTTANAADSGLTAGKIGAARNTVPVTGTTGAAGNAVPALGATGTGAGASPVSLPGLPTEKDLNNASETLARMGIQHLGAGNLDEQEDVRFVLPGTASDEDLEAKALSHLPGAKDRQCRTCAERKYQDGSNDMGVSFKTPTHLSPSQAASAVMSHEMEHVSHERANALEKGGEVVSQSVSIHTEFCPECGRAYVSGGETRTVTKTPVENDGLPKAA